MTGENHGAEEMQEQEAAQKHGNEQAAQEQQEVTTGIDYEKAIAYALRRRGHHLVVQVLLVLVMLVEGVAADDRIELENLPESDIRIPKGSRAAIQCALREFVEVGDHQDAPVIEEFPLTMECEVTEIQGDAHGARTVGRIVNTRVDESVLDDEGRVDFGKMRPIVYDSTRRIYRVVGEEVGGAWDAGMKLM